MTSNGLDALTAWQLAIRSVDSAVDIAEAAAAVILLEKDLMVLDDGVIEGRKVFVNILKFVRMGASSNFGNEFIGRHTLANRALLEQRQTTRHILESASCPHTRPSRGC